jgi:hypothetical protein
LIVAQERQAGGIMFDCSCFGECCGGIPTLKQELK